MTRRDQRAAQERRAFQREQIRLDRAIYRELCGLRCKQWFTVLPGSRTFGVVFLPILHYIHLFQQQPEEYCPLLHVVPADVFPRLLQAFCRFFEVPQLHLIQLWGRAPTGLRCCPSERARASWIDSPTTP
ncbi:hypothetical protein V8E54_014990 [Elaphomyces granulatus]